MRIVVVGATGNVGSRLVEVLEGDRGVSHVRGLARRVPDPALPGRTEYVSADITCDDLTPLFAGADVVIHLAWLIQPSHDETHLDEVNLGGTARVLQAVADAEVPRLVYASSVGAYSPGPAGSGATVDETWPTDGIPTNQYSRQKARTERMLDAFEADHASVRVVRLRPGLIFQRDSASEIRRLFLGPLVPTAIVKPGRLPFVPDMPGLAVQAVHAVDVAHAYRLAALDPNARGAYNVVSEPVLTPEVMAQALDSRALPIPEGLARGAAAVSWRAHLQPTPASWLDLAIRTPLLDASRIRSELGWQPRYTATEALRALVEGIHDGAGHPTPPLEAAAGGPARLREFMTRVGGRDDADR